MLDDALRLTAYLGERDRCGGQLLADAVSEVCERHGVRASMLLRGIEGFGIRHRLQTERLLSLSEDLPILATALDTPVRMMAVLEDIRRITRHGLITLERVRMVDAEALDPGFSPPAGEVKLTIYLGRRERAAGRPAYMAVVDCLQRHGLDGATVLLGLDGTAHGERRRGRFLARNEHVPLMVLSVGEGRGIARALPDLAAMLNRPTMTLERVRVCRRDGVQLAAPVWAPSLDTAGLAYWQKLVVHSSERARHGDEPLYSAIVRRLRHEGAAGATAIRGQWGYHGDHPPHGERFWSLARHVPVLTVVIDTPANARRWFEIIAEMTARTGLLTSEIVPALRAAGPEIEHGGLLLAAPLDRPRG